MMRWFCILLTGLFLMTSIAGCSDEPTSKPVAKKSKTTAKAPPKKVPPPNSDEEIQEESPKETFVYRSEGRRDPFVPLTSIRKPINKVSREPMTPLERFELTQYRLLGVIVGKGSPKAIVKAPDGKSYILMKGIRIGKNSGVIVDINSDAISIEEKYYDFSGNVRTNIQEIRVPKR